jgi:hypothetical protein
MWNWWSLPSYQGTGHFCWVGGRVYLILTPPKIDANQSKIKAVWVSEGRGYLKASIDY